MYGITKFYSSSRRGSRRQIQEKGAFSLSFFNRNSSRCVGKTDDQLQLQMVGTVYVIERVELEQRMNKSMESEKTVKRKY